MGFVYMYGRGVESAYVEAGWPLAPMLRAAIRGRRTARVSADHCACC